MKINEENNTPALRSLADVPDPVSRRLGGTRAVKFVEEVARNVFQQQSLDAQQGSTPFVSDLEIGENVVRLTCQSGLPDLDETCPLHAAVDMFRPGRRRKSTRLNSSHLGISYAVFCLKKK